MADENTHKRIAKTNVETITHLLDPSSLGGKPAVEDHPWIAVIAYYTACHLIEQAAATHDPQSHHNGHDDQLDFMQEHPILCDAIYPFNQLETIKKYATWRSSANNNYKTESKILGYADAENFKDRIISDWLKAVENAVEHFRKSLLSA